MNKVAGAGGAAAGQLVLLVDDDEILRSTLSSLLRATGYRVVEAPDHRLALQRLESDEPIDLLIVDVVMPDRVNGFALARMAQLRRPGIKTIYITGYDLPGIAGEALGPVIRKPIDEAQLLAEIARVLSA